MKKKNDKVIILLICLLVLFIFTWIIKGGHYSSGVFVDDGYKRAGIFDLISVIYQAFNYRLIDILYLFTIGGCYGVLTQTNCYRKLVDKTAALIKNKEHIALAVITLVMGIYTSITSHILVLMVIVPFIITVFIRNKQNRIIALCAGFGGILIGYLGSTFGIYGNYGVDYLNSVLNITFKSWLPFKIIIFLIAYILFNLFAILFMKKNKKVDATKADMFYVEELDETKVKKRNQTKIWPLLTVSIIVLLVLMLGYISWITSFKVTIFTEMYTSFASGFKIGDIPFFGTILGPYMNGFGEWGTLLYGTFILIIFTLIVALISKMNFSKMLTNFATGMGKISKVAFIYGFASIVVLMAASYGWQYTVINALFGDPKFNIFGLLMIAIIAQILIGDLDFFYFIADYISLNFIDNAVAAGLLWKIGSGIALIIGPTSFLLLMMLTYLNVPYTKWMKFIWKFVLSFMFILLLITAIIVYV